VRELNAREVRGFVYPGRSVTSGIVTVDHESAVAKGEASTVISARTRTYDRDLSPLE